MGRKLCAIIHRDYTSPVDIQIKIFDQSISFFNPGKLFGNLTIEELSTDTYQSHMRNKLIAEAFYLTKDIEKYGSGYIRIRKEILSYPTMILNYKEVGSGFLVEIHYKKQKISTKPTDHVTENVGVSVGVSVGVNDGVNSLLKLVEDYPGIKSAELREKLNVSQRTVERWLKYLRDEQKIVFKGAFKTGGYWLIK